MTRIDYLTALLVRFRFASNPPFARWAFLSAVAAGGGKWVDARHITKRIGPATNWGSSAVSSINSKQVEVDRSAGNRLVRYRLTTEGEKAIADLLNPHSAKL